jgi:hypothetical protein
MSKKKRKKLAWVWWVFGAVMLLACVVQVFDPPPPKAEPVVIEVQAGQLGRVIGTIPMGATINVRKLGGALAPRPGDLEELARDWLFWRGRILEQAAKGQESKAAESRVQFQAVNRQLAEYDQGDVSTMIAAIEAGR